MKLMPVGNSYKPQNDYIRNNKNANKAPSFQASIEVKSFTKPLQDAMVSFFNKFNPSYQLHDHYLMLDDLLKAFGKSTDDLRGLFKIKLNDDAQSLQVSFSSVENSTAQSRAFENIELGSLMKKVVEGPDGKLNWTDAIKRIRRIGDEYWEILRAQNVDKFTREQKINI